MTKLRQLRYYPASVVLLFLLLTGVALASTLIATWILYDTAVENEGNRLYAAAALQAQALELQLADSDAISDRAEIFANIQTYDGMGETGEFTFGKEVGRTIEFLGQLRHLPQGERLSLAMSADEAEPVRNAILGRKGVMIGKDYRGQTVIAGYHPVANAQIGVVAKIDLAEVSQPYWQAFFVALGVALALSGLGGYALYYLNRRIIDQLATSRAELQIGFEGIIQALSNALDHRDPYTGGHQRRVALIAEQVAKKLKLGKQCIEGVRIGAMIHDIGKIKVPAEILNRPGKLTEAEMNVVKSHPLTGHEILENINLPWPVHDVILQHHELLDGSGYPFGLKKGEISLEARIVGPCDALEAIISHRPYRPAKSLEQAIGFLKSESGKSFDAEIVDALLALIEEGKLDSLLAEQGPLPPADQTQNDKADRLKKAS